MNEQAVNGWDSVSEYITNALEALQGNDFDKCATYLGQALEAGEAAEHVRVSDACECLNSGKACSYVADLRRAIALDMIRPVDVNTVWDDIQPLIAEMCDMTGDDTTPDDVLAAVRQQQAFIYSVEGGHCFIIVKPVVHPKTLSRGLRIMFGQNWTLKREWWESCVDALASQSGATYVEFCSRREV